MRARFVIVATLWLLACGEDPILARAREDAAAAAMPAEAGAPPAGDPSSPPPGGAVGVPPAAGGETAKGVASEPEPVKAPDPPRAPPGAPGGGAPGIPGQEGGAGVPGAGGQPGDPATPPPTSGPTITVTGTVVYSAWKKGEVRVDAFDGDHSVHGTHPGVVASARLTKPGSFTLTVPENTGKLYIEAVVDEDQDGRPGPQDPMGTAERYPVTVETSPVEGIAIKLVKHEAPTDGKGKGDF